MKDRGDDYLRYTRDLRIPFTNDAAEHAIRMSKLRIKISGCMRSMAGAQGFCAIRSYLATAATASPDSTPSPAPSRETPGSPNRITGPGTKAPARPGQNRGPPTLVTLRCCPWRAETRQSNPCIAAPRGITRLESAQCGRAGGRRTDAKKFRTSGSKCSSGSLR
jgi:Transposase IS66 family